MSTRIAARAIVLHDDKLLLMERWRPGRHYFSIPGGGLEPGETPEAAVRREVLEETSCQIEVGREVYTVDLDDGSHHHIFLCKYMSGEPKLPEDSPEALKMHDDNQYKPCWVDIADLPDLPIYVWNQVQLQLLHDLQFGFPAHPLKLA